MPNQTRSVAPGPTDRTVRTADGQILHAPADWELLPPGDPGLTRRVKTAGPTWTVREKKGSKTFSRGVWAPTARIAAIRAELESERSTDAYPVPVGGVAFIIGWLMLAIGAMGFWGKN